MLYLIRLHQTNLQDQDYRSMSNSNWCWDAAEIASNEQQATHVNTLKIATEAYDSKMSVLISAQTEMPKAKMET